MLLGRVRVFVLVAEDADFTEDLTRRRNDRPSSDSKPSFTRFGRLPSLEPSSRDGPKRMTHAVVSSVSPRLEMAVLTTLAAAVLPSE